MPRYSIFSHTQVARKAHSADLHRTDIECEDEVELQQVQQELAQQGHRITGCLTDYVPPQSVVVQRSRWFGRD